MVSCTDKLHILHKYCAYDKSFPCPLKLSGAVSTSEDVLPLGEGFLHVPAINQQDFVAVRCFETDVDYEKNFESQVLQNSSSMGTRPAIAP